MICEIEAMTEMWEEAGLGGRHIWVARDGNGCLYSYTSRPVWNEDARRWQGRVYGTFTNDVYPWVKPGMLVGFEMYELETQPLI